MSFVEQAVEGVEAEAEYGRLNSCCSTPPSSFQHIQSRLIRPVPTAVTFLQFGESSSQHIHPSKEAAHTDFVVNLAEEGEELELEDKTCDSTPTFEQHLIPSGSVPAMSSIFHPSHKNDARNHCNTADNLVVELGEERGSSAPLSSSFQLIQQRLVRRSPATQPSLVSHFDQSSQCSVMEHTVGHFEAHKDGTLKNSGTLKVVAQKQEEKGLELKVVANEPGSSMPFSSFQFFQSSPSTSAPTIGLHQINQSSALHHLAPLSVFQDCLKQMRSVGSIGRGDVCRRRLFSKSIDLDEDATITVPISAKRARIEDYVDTFLLSEAAQKIRLWCQQDLLHSNSLQLEFNPVRSSSSFDWPTADLQAMRTSIRTDCCSLTTQQKLQTTQAFVYLEALLPAYVRLGTRQPNLQPGAQQFLPLAGY